MADITLTIPVDQEQRVQDAFESHLGGPATLADVKTFCINQIKELVRVEERKAAIAAEAAAAGDLPDIT